MNITKAGIEKMVVAIAKHEDYTSLGTYGENRALKVVPLLCDFAETIRGEFFHIPDGLLPHLWGSTLGHITRGYGRPLGHLCSDCRYPKWLLTPDEVRAQYNNETYLERAEKPLKNGFADVTGACPVCGD